MGYFFAVVEATARTFLGDRPLGIGLVRDDFCGGRGAATFFSEAPHFEELCTSQKPSLEEN